MSSGTCKGPVRTQSCKCQTRPLAGRLHPCRGNYVNQMKTKGLSAAEAFLQLLADMDVDRIFAYPGSEWAPVWESLANPILKSRPKYLSSRHEEIAVGMASGYAKATGRLPAVMLHTTVGVLHASMAMRGA